MLPFVIGGGIMIALAFLLDQIMGVPKDQLSQLGSYHEIVCQFKAIGGAPLASCFQYLQVTLLTLSLKNQVWYQVS
ncbi:MAG: hypothetical protein ACLS5G_03320 [Streptococcus sp.]